MFLDVLFKTIDLLAINLFIFDKKISKKAIKIHYAYKQIVTEQ